MLTTYIMERLFMRILDVIIKKRNGLPLNQEEFNLIAQGAAKGTIPDYQLSDHQQPNYR